MKHLFITTKSPLNSFKLSSSLLAFALLSCAKNPLPQSELGNAEVSQTDRRPAASADDLDRLEERVKNVNMFDYRMAVIRSRPKLADGYKAVEAANQELIKILDRTSASSLSLQADARPGASWRASITMKEAENLYQWLETHKVAASSNIEKYDPEIRIGFCFGRATAVHLQALHKPWRLFPKSIRKIWVIGPMVGGWGHHVATLVHVNDGPHVGFYAIDPVTSGVVSAREWMQTVTSQYKLNEPLMFFVTEPSRFGPFPGKYTKIDLFGPQRGNVSADAYRGYFNDLMKKFHVDTTKKLKAAEKTLAQELNIVNAIAPDLMSDDVETDTE